MVAINTISFDYVIVRSNLVLQLRCGSPNLGRHDVRWARMHDLSLMTSDMSQWCLGLGTNHQSAADWWFVPHIGIVGKNSSFWHSLIHPVYSLGWNCCSRLTRKGNRVLLWQWKWMQCHTLFASKRLVVLILFELRPGKVFQAMFWSNASTTAKSV